MAEYIDRERLKQCFHANICGGNAYDELIDMQPTADVVERSKIDNAIEEIKQTLYVDSLIFGELFDFKNGKISADDVIEEFNRVTRIEVLEILKRNIGE